MNDANNAGIEPGPCPKCGCDSYVAGEPYWKHDGQWTAAACVTCDKCDHRWGIALTLSTPNAPVEREAIALDHLGNALYYAAAIHPDHRNQAIENAIAYYNVARPNAQVDPNEHASLRTYDPILAVRLDEAAIRKDEREKCCKDVCSGCASGIGFNISGFHQHLDYVWPCDAQAIRNGGKQP